MIQQEIANKENNTTEEITRVGDCENIAKCEEN